MGDWDTGRDLLQEFDIALNQTREIASKEKDRFWSGNGRSIKHNARVIALEIAKIYVLGNGKLPPIGRREDGREPSGPYCHAVRNILSLLAIKTDFYAPCEEAIAALQNNKGSEFRKLIDLRKKPGIIQYYPRKT